MRMILRTAVTAALLMALTVPSLAHATSYEDSLQDCGYPVIFDLAIMRPLSLVALGIGTALFIPLAPWGIMTAAGDMDKVASALIGAPAVFTFNRPLGACGTGRTYR